MKNKLTSLLLVLLFALLAASTIPAHADTQNEVSLTIGIDTSGSMRGEKIRQVKESISYILNEIQIPASYSLVIFNSSAKLLVDRAKNKSELLQSLASIQANGTTALYDGVKIGIETIANSKNSVVVIFSDGEDNASITGLDPLKEKVSAFGGLLVLVGLGDSKTLATRLGEIAGTNGKVLSVRNLEDLTGSINSIIQPTLNNGLTIQSAKSTQSENQYLLIFLVFACSFLVFLLALFVLMRARSSRKQQIDLLSAYDHDQVKEDAENSVFYQLMKNPIFSKYVKNEEKRLLSAGLALDVRSWFYIQISIFIGICLFLLSSGITLIVALPLAAVLGFGLGNTYLNLARKRKAAAFAEELPDTLMVISSSLKSGLSFNQAITSVANESDGEFALQMRRVLAEVQVGRHLTDSLLDVADRMNSQDFRWTISALSIQREIGGNLSEILTSTVETIRGRSEIRNEIKALSAEGRMSAYVLVGLPIMMLLYLKLTKPEYFRVFFTQPAGMAMFIVVAILMSVGWIWVKKVVDIKLT